MVRFTALLAGILLLPSLGFAQFDIPGIGGTTSRPTKFADMGSISAEITPAKARRGEAVTVKITVTPNLGNWTYPTQVPEGQTGKNRIAWKSDLFVLRELKDPTGTYEKDSIDRIGAKDIVYNGPVTWEYTGWVKLDAAVGKTTLDLIGSGVAVQICDKNTCFNARKNDLEPLAFEITDDAPVKLAGDALREYERLAGVGVTPVTPNIKPTAPNPPAEEVPAGLVKKKSQPFAEYQANLNQLQQSLTKLEVKREGGITTLLLTAAFWGLISLATPCVFPMIPITVSLFLKQGNQTTQGALKQAGIYCGTIILVLGLSAIFLLSVFRELSLNPWMNVGLGLLFVFFALSLFGMYDITLPNSWLRVAEGKRKQGGLFGTVFGAIAFSIVSFTCVAPFLGGFAGMASSGQFSQVELALAGLTFASAFAAPFFILALFPSLLKQLPKSGGWMDNLKAVMGFLELAAALKFLRSAELVWSSEPQFFTYDIVLTAWVVIALATGFYLLNFFRLPHDEEQPSIGVLRMMFAILFLIIGIYLLPGLFKSGDKGNQRPNGVVFAWVDAFLLPEPSQESSDLAWRTDLPAAIEEARKTQEQTGENQYVFVDFTGVLCTNCKANENTVFPKPAVFELMKQYTTVQMYTDIIPAEAYSDSPSATLREQEAAEGNLLFQRQVFGTEQLPLYVILHPTSDGVRVVDIYAEGKINNEAAFIEFLQNPLKNGE